MFLALSPGASLLLELAASMSAALGWFLVMSLMDRNVGRTLPRLGIPAWSGQNLRWWTGALLVYVVLVGRIVSGVPLGAVDLGVWAVGMALAVALHVHDLREWRYAVVGDVMLFYLRTQEIIHDGIFDPFTVHGIYHHSPMLNSVYQALFVWPAPDDGWGWKSRR